jgi:hypothetical protein
MNFREAMNEVLETSRYDDLTGRNVDIRESIARRLEEFFDNLFGGLDLNFPEMPTSNLDLIANIFGIVAIIIAAVALFVFVRTMLRLRIPKRHRLSDIFEELKNHTVAELLEISRNAENQRTAVRYKYIAAILSLNERGVITIEPSATNAIILRQLKNTAPQFHADFSKIADAFHLTWFGHKTLNEIAFENFGFAVEKVVEHG